MLLLRLRHWQTFLLLFMLPFALQYGLRWLLDALDISTGAVADALINALPATVYILWLWYVGLWLFRRLPASIKISPIYFQLGALYFILYTLLFVYTLSVVQNQVITGIFPLGMLLLLMPLHLLSTFCYLYLAYFVARALVSVEQQQEVAFGAYASTCFLCLLLPLGIWWLQPRLRRLYLQGL